MIVSRGRHVMNLGDLSPTNIASIYAFLASRKVVSHLPNPTLEIPNCFAKNILHVPTFFLFIHYARIRDIRAHTHTRARMHVYRYTHNDNDILPHSLRQLLLGTCSRKLRDGQKQYVARLTLQLKREHVLPLSYTCTMPCMFYVGWKLGSL